MLIMLKLVYVNTIGKNSADQYIYEFYFSDESTIESFWIPDAEVKPCSICNLAVPENTVYDTIKILKTKCILNVAQRNSCFSFQDCKDGIIPVAWENIDDAEEYPEDGRFIFPFGFEIEYVEQTLARRNLSFEGDNLNNNPF